MINSYKKPEILAPCGSYDIMIAAINAGADACYFGGNKFGARAYATNFDLETSLKAIDYAHIHGSSLYLTVNTLFKDNEIDDLYNYLLPYYEAGLDAVIVQDLGVFKFVKDNFPDMNIHCSTQMNITSRYAAKGMKELGASRIVTAREMSIEEIAQIKNDVDIEIESFVHGAMCYSYSGRCLMSSLAGGRSGNRGRCAQPCRKAYDGEYILSMKDMCTLTDVPRLIDAGIDSLKIEGRMKNEYYVASAVDAYNQIATDYVEGCYSEKKALELKFKLANIYNRGGFCGGYYYMHHGPEMISKDRPNNQGVKLGKVTWAKDGQIGISLNYDLYKQDVIEIKLKNGSFVEITSGKEGSKDTQVTLNCPKTKLVQVGQLALRTRCNYIINDIEESILKASRKYLLYGEFNGEIGKNLSLTVGRNIGDEYIKTTVCGDIVQEARDKGVSVEDLKHKLSQLGNTCYTFADLLIKVDDNSFIPSSALKNLRRQAILSLEEKICHSYRRKANYRSFYDAAKKMYNNLDKPEISIGVSNVNQLNLVLSKPWVDNIFMSTGLYVNCLKDNKIDRLKSSDIKIFLELPLIIKNTFDLSAYLPDDAFDGIYIRNLDGLLAYYEYIKNSKYDKDKLRVICGDGLYSYNSLARAFIEELVPCAEFELPRELNKRELLELGYGHNHLVVYEHQQVMLSAQCVVKNKTTCNQSSSIVKLKDDKNNIFFAKACCNECCNVIYNGIPYMILDEVNDAYLKDMHINNLRFNFTVEDDETVAKILDLAEVYVNEEDCENITTYIKHSAKTYTSGHFNRGVE